MTTKRRYTRDPKEKASEKICFRVNPLDKMVIECEVDDEMSEFWRTVARKIADAIEAGDPVVTIPLRKDV